MRSAALGAVLALHALALGALLAYEPARSALLAAAPIMVELIAPVKDDPKLTPQRASPPAPRPEAKPSPPASAPFAPQPVVTAPAEAPSPVVLPPPQVALAAPEPAPVASAPPRPAPAPTPVAALTAPVFNADYLDNPAPAYPVLSRRLGEQGRVILRVLVSAAGSIEEVQIRASSGHARLDEAACETVRRWKFIPARRGDQPVAAWVLVPISFRLEG